MNNRIIFSFLQLRENIIASSYEEKLRNCLKKKERMKKKGGTGREIGVHDTVIRDPASFLMLIYYNSPILRQNILLMSVFKIRFH